MRGGLPYPSTGTCLQHCIAHIIVACARFSTCHSTLMHCSDIVKQMRGRAKPDGLVFVVGSCAEGVLGMRVRGAADSVEG